MARSARAQPKSGSRTLAAKPAGSGGSTSSTPRRKRTKAEDPWLEGLGMFKDDPTFVPMMKEIYRDRAGEYS